MTSSSLNLYIILNALNISQLVHIVNADFSEGSYLKNELIFYVSYVFYPIIADIIILLFIILNSLYTFPLHFQKYQALQQVAHLSLQEVPGNGLHYSMYLLLLPEVRLLHIHL